MVAAIAGYVFEAFFIATLISGLDQLFGLTSLPREIMANSARRRQARD